jgi:hypothetical protein
MPTGKKSVPKGVDCDPKKKSGKKKKGKKKK